MSPFLRRHWRLFSALTLALGAGWIALTAIFWPVSAGGGAPAPREGFLAPEFELSTGEAGSVRLADLRGQAVLINVWASWCPPCRAEMPAIQKVYHRYRDQGFTVIAINALSQDNRADAQAFLDAGGYDFMVTYDPQGQVSRQYQVRALPSSFFVDREGVIRKVVIGGPMSEALLRAEIEKLLAETP